MVIFGNTWGTPWKQQLGTIGNYWELMRTHWEHVENYVEQSGKFTIQNISQNHAYSIPTIFHGFTLNEKKSHVGLTILFC
jgi:hypothetical protein